MIGITQAADVNMCLLVMMLPVHSCLQISGKISSPIETSHGCLLISIVLETVGSKSSRNFGLTVPHPGFDDKIKKLMIMI